MLGMFLKAMPKATGGDRAGRRSKLGSARAAEPNLPPKVTELGLTHHEAADAQILAAVKEKHPADFEKIKAREKTKGRFKNGTV